MNTREIANLKQYNTNLKKKNEEYRHCIKIVRSYILNHSTYELPNEWTFHGDISLVFDLLSPSCEYYKNQRGNWNKER